jgi:hypothetical protein
MSGEAGTIRRSTRAPAYEGRAGSSYQGTRRSVELAASWLGRPSRLCLIAPNPSLGVEQHCVYESAHCCRTYRGHRDCELQWDEQASLEIARRASDSLACLQQPLGEVLKHAIPAVQHWSNFLMIREPVLGMLEVQRVAMGDCREPNPGRDVVATRKCDIVKTAIKELLRFAHEDAVALLWPVTAKLPMHARTSLADLVAFLLPGPRGYNRDI